MDEAQTVLARDPGSLARWQRLRPSWRQMLALGTDKEGLHYLRDGDLELWGNGFMLLRGNPPDVPLLDRSEEINFRFSVKSLLQPGPCSVEPLLYVEADGYGPQDRSLLLVEMRSPADGHLMEHLAVNARMALFVERECRSRFPEDWVLGWRGNLSAESQGGSLPPMCARIHPKPLTYCVRRPDSDAIVAGVLQPRTTGSGVSGRLTDGATGMVLRYDVERRVYIRETA